MELYRDDNHFSMKKIPFAREHGTTVFVEDLFHAIPAREKFLKSDQTEWRYIKDTFLSFALIHRSKAWNLTKDGKVLYNFLPASSLLERILHITKKDREKHLKQISYKDEQLELYGVA